MPDPHGPVPVGGAGGRCGGFWGAFDHLVAWPRSKAEGHSPKRPPKKPLKRGPGGHICASGRGFFWRPNGGHPKFDTNRAGVTPNLIPFERGSPQI